jgi:membrane protease YdiL (CAAX protease family)
VTAAAAAGPDDQTVGDSYPRLLRTPRSAWWRPVLGLLLAAASVVLAATMLVLVAMLVSRATDGSADGSAEDALDPDTVLGLLTNNLVIALLAPAAVLAVLVVHRERVGWLASVTGRVRWSLLWRLLALALVVVVVFFAVGFLLPSSDDQDVSAPAARTLVGLLAVILLSTPLQAAAEEVWFRGYLTQAVSSWVARPAAGIATGAAVSAVSFALAHGSQDVWLFGDRLAFGLVASWLAWRTGGLEAPVALHVTNNLVSLAFSAATGSLDDSLSASTLDWQFAALDVVMMLTFAVVVHRLVGRRWPVATRRVLSGHGAVGYPEHRPPTPPPAGREFPWGMG